MAIKVVFVGAGSFVFGPTMLAQAFLENRLSDLDLVLVDPAAEILEPVAELGRRMAASKGLKTKISTYRDAGQPGVLEGAQFVISCVAVEMNRRFRIDREVIRERYPEHLITEFGGVQGISSTMRQLAFVRKLAEEMRRRCPDAWLLDVANPLPRVCQAAYEAGIQTVGFCSVSLSGYGKLWEILRGEKSNYPFSEPRQALRATMGGTNHLSWLVSLSDRASGADLMPELRRRLAERATTVRSKSEEWGRKTGHLLMSGDAHVQDFLPPEGLEVSLELTSHGSDEDRQRRLETLIGAAKGERPWDELLSHPSWERPFDFIQAMTEGQTAEFESLNLVNQGQIPELPNGVYVETGAVVNGKQVLPNRLHLPESVAKVARDTAELHALLVRASTESSLALIDGAIERDPTILDKAKGRAATRQCLNAHADLIGPFS